MAENSLQGVKLQNHKRMANMELLRIIAMMMVVVLHYLGKGELLQDLTVDMNAAGYTAWALEALAIVAVNTYMLLSGYFLVESRFKVSRLLGLVLQACFYSVLVPVVLVLMGVLDAGDITLYQLLHYVFPTQMEHYWFLTAYVAMYLFSPLLSIAVHHMSKKQHGLVLAGLLILVSLGKSVLPVRLEMDEFGYDAVWFMCVYLVAAYIRLYGIPFFKNKKISGCMYLLGCAGIFGITMLLHFCYVKWNLFGYFLEAAYDYNHLLNLFAAVALFYVFVRMDLGEGKIARFVCRIAPYTFGVYLLHEQIEVRYLWPGWLGAGRTENPLALVGFTLLAVLVVFTVGVVVDMLRSLLFKGVGILLGKLGVLKIIDRLDAVFAKQQGGEEKQVDGAVEGK